MGRKAHSRASQTGKGLKRKLDCHSHGPPGLEKEWQTVTVRECQRLVHRVFRGVCRCKWVPSGHQCLEIYSARIRLILKRYVLISESWIRLVLQYARLVPQVENVPLEPQAHGLMSFAHLQFLPQVEVCLCIHRRSSIAVNGPFDPVPRRVMCDVDECTALVEELAA